MLEVYVRGNTPKIWACMVQYLHFRIQNLPLMFVGLQPHRTHNGEINLGELYTITYYWINCGTGPIVSYTSGKSHLLWNKDDKWNSCYMVGKLWRTASLPEGNRSSCINLSCFLLLDGWEILSSSNRPPIECGIFLGMWIPQVRSWQFSSWSYLKTPSQFNKWRIHEKSMHVDVLLGTGFQNISNIILK